MEIREKIRNIIKNKFGSKHIYSTKYIKAEKKKINTKGGFQGLYAPVILIDSVYRKDENDYPKLFLEEYHFIEDIEICCSRSDRQYYDEELVNLFLETLKNKRFFRLGL